MSSVGTDGALIWKLIKLQQLKHTIITPDQICCASGMEPPVEVAMPNLKIVTQLKVYNVIMRRRLFIYRGMQIRLTDFPTIPDHYYSRGAGHILFPFILFYGSLPFSALKSTAQADSCQKWNITRVKLNSEFYKCSWWSVRVWVKDYRLQRH